MAIFTIIADIFWFVLRFFKIYDKPANQYQRAKETNAEIIATGDSDRLNTELDRLTDRLPIDPKVGGDKQ